jgi:hypothetical protein
MVMPTNVDKAAEAIAKMPWGFWIDVRTLSKGAGLSVRTMSRYLSQAKKRGLVDNKRIALAFGRMHLCRRVA